MAETYPNAWNQTPNKDRCLPLEKLVMLQNWYLTKVEDGDGGGKKLGVAGYHSKGQLGMELFYSAPIIERIDAFTLRTSDGFRILLDGLINGYHTRENGFPLEAQSYFMIGFPFTWEACAAKYIPQDSTSQNSASVSDPSQGKSNIKPGNDNTTVNMFTKVAANPNFDVCNVPDVGMTIPKGTPRNNNGKNFCAEILGKYVKDPSIDLSVQTTKIPVDTGMGMAQGSSSKCNSIKKISRLKGILDATKFGLKELRDEFLLKNSDNGYVEGGNGRGNKVPGGNFFTDNPGSCSGDSLKDSSVKIASDPKIESASKNISTILSTGLKDLKSNKIESQSNLRNGNTKVASVLVGPDFTGDLNIDNGIGIAKESTSKYISMRSSARLKTLENDKIDNQSNQKNENSKVASVLVGPDFVGDQVEEPMLEESRDKLPGELQKGILKCQLNIISSPVYTDVNRRLDFGHAVDATKPSDTSTGVQPRNDKPEATSERKGGRKKTLDPPVNQKPVFGVAMDRIEPSDTSTDVQQSNDKPEAMSEKKRGRKKKDPLVSQQLVFGHAIDQTKPSDIPTDVQPSNDKPSIKNGKKLGWKKKQDPPGFQPSLTRYQMEKSSEKLNLKVTKSGRRLKLINFGWSILPIIWRSTPCFPSFDGVFSKLHGVALCPKEGWRHAGSARNKTTHRFRYEFGIPCNKPGRLSISPLADWCNEQLVYDKDGSITGLSSPADMVSTRTRKRKVRGEH